MKQRRLTFANQQGLELAALMDLPAGRPRAYALFAHCFTCTKNIRAASHIASALAAEGIAVLRFDFTGLGQSAGEFAETTFSSNVEDLVAAARFLEARFEPPRILIGHSLGGTAVLQAAAQIASSVAVATIGSPARASHVAHLLVGERERIEREGEAEVRLGGRPFRIRRQFLEDLERHGLPQSLRDLRRALLVFHSPLDTTVDIGNAAEIFQHAKHPKSFVTLDRADHLLSDPRDSRYVGTVLAAWAAKYLEPAAANQDLGAGTAPGTGEVVARTVAGGFRTDIDVADHRLVADEPEELGGTAEGPSPYDLLAAALASCTSMTLVTYARRKGLGLESATTRVRHSKIHARDCEVCESSEGRIDRFERRLELTGTLSDSERARLREIAERCPVHRSLHSEVEVVTAVEPA